MCHPTDESHIIKRLPDGKYILQCQDCQKTRTVKCKPKPGRSIYCGNCASGHKKQYKLKENKLTNSLHSTTCPTCKKDREVSYSTWRNILNGNIKVCKSCHMKDRNLYITKSGSRIPKMKVNVTCPNCLKVRTMIARTYNERKTDYCGSCSPSATHKGVHKPNNGFNNLPRVEVVCACGAIETRTKHMAPKFKQCKKCSKKGNNQRYKAKANKDDSIKQRAKAIKKRDKNRTKVTTNHKMFDKNKIISVGYEDLITKYLNDGGSVTKSEPPLSFPSGGIMYIKG